MRKKTILIITDGIGHKVDSKYNAFEKAKKPTYDKLFKNYPNSLIKTYGLSVGLPDGQMGNSEVGHMSIGSGRILYQDLVKISMALENKTLKDNKNLINLLNSSNNIHIAGLLSDGGVHSHIEHFKGISKIASEKGKKVYLHLITDGRDVSPTSAKNYISEIESICDETISIASIGGRFYAMDRDNRWERVKRGYDSIVNASVKTDLNIKDYIDFQYKKDVLDEFIEPISFNDYEGAKDGDGFIFVNFRSDRMREIVTAIGDKNFNEFETSNANFNVLTMTEYNKEFPYPTMFSKEAPKNTLSETISRANLTQSHIAETEKYAHVTFFFNGGVDTPFDKEDRVLIPSPNVKTYDEKPEMSAEAVADAVLNEIDAKKDFIVVNFANGDMVGHTGVFEAGIKAVESVDTQIGRVLDKAKDEYSILITSDHGNCEEMKDCDNNVLTNHTVGDVYCFLIDSEFKTLKDGGLNNIAPTVLKLMGLEIPSEMDEALI